VFLAEFAYKVKLYRKYLLSPTGQFDTAQLIKPVFDSQMTTSFITLHVVVHSCKKMQLISLEADEIP